MYDDDDNNNNNNNNNNKSHRRGLVVNDNGYHSMVWGSIPSDNSEL